MGATLPWHSRACGISGINGSANTPERPGREKSRRRLSRQAIHEFAGRAGGSRPARTAISPSRVQCCPRCAAEHFAPAGGWRRQVLRAALSARNLRQAGNRVGGAHSKRRPRPIGGGSPPRARSVQENGGPPIECPPFFRKRY